MQYFLFYSLPIFNIFDSPGAQKDGELDKKSHIIVFCTSRYNNKTYKIDDISWNQHPTDSFPKRDGTQITYKEYYQQMYEQAPQDDEQPLLVSNPKKRVRNFLQIDQRIVK